jgi:phosphate-selective porin OprO/OprP
MLTVIVTLTTAVILAPVAGAQSPPRKPTPVVTPSPSPSPEPTAVAAPTPSTTPVPEDADDVSPTPAPSVDEKEAENTTVVPQETPAAEPAAEEESTPKSEVETNPGDVAFTDYAAFDLDEIEYQPVKSKWKNFTAGFRGLARYSLWDGKVKFRLGARFQLDGTAGSGNSKYEEFYAPIESDFSVRRFTAYAAGRIRKFNFNLAFEFGADWGLSDAWIEGAEGGLEVWGHYLGKLRLGFLNEPFSLERQTGSFNIGLLERSLPVQTIAPGTNLGWMIHDAGRKQRFTWAAGIFSFGQTNDNNASGSALSLTGRFTYLPVYRDEGRDLIHLGVSLSSRSPRGGEIRYRSRPEARFVDYLVDTGNMDVSQLTLIGLEFAAVRGPLWMQAEYIRSKAQAQNLDDPTFNGSYVQVGWFLTGESKPYRTNSGTFDRLRPLTKYTKGNPFKKRNGGAWELVGRLSRVDLTDGLVEGGELTDISAGLSWFINATSRVELNYIYASPKNQGSANIFLLRVQYNPW